MNFRFEILAVVSLLAAGCASSSPGASTTEPAGCDVAGVHYGSGQFYCCDSIAQSTPITKGNTCWCLSGEIKASAVYCDSTADAGKGDSADAAPTGCVNEGVHYDEGQTYCCGASATYTPTPKGNTCSCRGGAIVASALFCDSTADAGPDSD